MESDVRRSEMKRILFAVLGSLFAVGVACAEDLSRGDRRLGSDLQITNRRVDGEGAGW